MTEVEDDLAFRESVFRWLSDQLQERQALSRDDLSRFPIFGQTYRLVAPQQGIWRVKEYSDAAISILTSYAPNPNRRPYEDSVGEDGLLRYKWRGIDPSHYDNVFLRKAMQRQLPLVWFVGIGYAPGTQIQLFIPQFPVWLIAEEPEQHQFVVAVEEGQRVPSLNDPTEIREIRKRYNHQLVKVRHHQPLFRAAVIHAYERKCAVCGLPFAELLEAAHIRPDAKGGAAIVTNGISLCRIHHGAYDTNIMGIAPDLTIHVRPSVLETNDGPTLQHSIKGVDGQSLRQLPRSRNEHPDRDLLEERFVEFERAG
jgi:putative restriction endonuclease